MSDAARTDTADIAQGLWGVYFGEVRKPSPVSRLHKGQKRRANSTDAGLASFNRKRHKSDLKSAPGVSTPLDIERLADNQIRQAGLWTPAMQKEHDFQMKKIVRAAGEAYVTGSLLQSEVALVAEVGEEHKAARAKALHKRRLQESRKAASLAPTKPLSFSSGGQVYLDPSAAEFAAAVSRTIEQHRMVRADDAVEAAGGYIVVARPDTGGANRWVAVLAGCALVTPDYFCSSCKSGSCLSWTAAVRTKRDVWLSPEWQRDDPLLANILKWAIRLPASKWRLRDWSPITYVAKQRRQKGLVGIVSERQKTIASFQALRHAFAPDAFLEFVGKLNVSVSGHVNPGSAPASPSPR